MELRSYRRDVGRKEMIASWAAAARGGEETLGLSEWEGAHQRRKIENSPGDLFLIR